MESPTVSSIQYLVDSSFDEEPASGHSITIRGLFCSQVISQNFSIVASTGAWVAMKAFLPYPRIKVYACLFQVYTYIDEVGIHVGFTLCEHIARFLQIQLDGLFTLRSLGGPRFEYDPSVVEGEDLVVPILALELHFGTGVQVLYMVFVLSHSLEDAEFHIKLAL